jgi:hypothetical protein
MKAGRPFVAQHVVVPDLHEGKFIGRSVMDWGLACCKATCRMGGRIGPKSRLEQVGEQMWNTSGTNWGEGGNKWWQLTRAIVLLNGDDVAVQPDNLRSEFSNHLGKTTKVAILASWGRSMWSMAHCVPGGTLIWPPLAEGGLDIQAVFFGRCCAILQCLRIEECIPDASRAISKHIADYGFPPPPVNLLRLLRK